MDVHFFNESSDFYLPDPQAISKWLNEVSEKEGRVLGELSIIFCDDEHLLKINQQYLNHDYYTDIITFDYSTEDSVSGDLFISIDRLEENAENHKVRFMDEVNRVMVHGLLHLLGYKDKTKENEQIMRKKEDHYLLLLAD